MYTLTCPSCSARTGSPFIRHGAMVVCDSCENKYRIKSTFVTRTVTTGPKTLDEMDPLLRGDSVDLDTAAIASTDDPAPVKIDEDGNVVGLSGLSELMRQSDAAHAQAAAIARTRAADDTAPPAARVTRPADPAAAPGRRPAGARRTTRARPRKRKRQPTGLIIVAALLLLACAIGVLAYVLAVRGGDPVVQNPPGDGPGAGNPDTAGTPGNPDIDLFPNNPETNPDNNPDNNPDGPNGVGTEGDPSWLTGRGAYEPNPDNLYDPNASRAAEGPPTDVPTVLTVAEVMEHEGWYILAPPRRGGIEAVGSSEVELGALEAVNDDGTSVMLEAELTNSGSRVVVAGEAHIALLNPAGRVFAETYLPFAALHPGESRTVRLSIGKRYWDRARDVRTRAAVLEDAEDLNGLADVRVASAGAGAWSSVRVTVRNPDRRWLRDALVLLRAEDIAGQTVARFRSVQDDLYIEPDGWLDIVLKAPLPENTSGPVTWHVEVVRR